MKGLAFYRNRFVDLSAGPMRRRLFRRTPEPSRKATDIHPGVDNPDQRIQADITNVASVGSSLLWGRRGVPQPTAY